MTFTDAPKNLSFLFALIYRLAVALADAILAAAPRLWPDAPSGPPRIARVTEDATMKAKKYTIAPFPPPAGADVASHKLYVSIDGAEPTVSDVPLGATLELAPAVAGTTIKIPQADVNAAGVVGPQGPALELTVTFPPDAPAGAPTVASEETVDI